MIRQLTRNTLLLVCSQVIARAVGLLYFIFLARSLGVEVFGIYTFTLAFIYNFIPIADFGLERLVLKEVARNTNQASFYFSKLVLLRLLMAVLALLGAVLLGIILRQSTTQIFYFAVFGLSLLPYNITCLITALQNAREKMGYAMFANIGGIFLTGVLGVVFVWLKLPLVWVLFAYFLGNCLILFVFLKFLSVWNWQLKIEIDWPFWKTILARAWIFGVLVVLSVFYLRLSLILTGLLSSSYITGLYGSVFKFVDASVIIPYSLAVALFPATSRMFVTEKEKLARLYLKVLGILLLLSLPFLVVLTFFSGWVVELVYGPNYLQAASTLSILGIALVLFFVNSLPGNIIQNSSRLKHFLPFALANFLVKLVFCLLLIPKYSLVGAAWAVVGGELVGLVINNLFVWRVLKE